ncbi:MotE family protein [Litoreibacter roseus]|uniref:Flagellar motility protein MotE (MotC chaperone) n=1 Tax=Litoreibacter roseus TaxID=2601869 RepID=A0A6N6JF32_9RHOB|nr:hypothetical protein [Litoreibacter roseus]GFE64400.1 hypothetical protein KIN_14740 [Litoreibacter roseus]
MAMTTHAAPRTVLLTIIGLLLASGFIRLGTIGAAIARDQPQPVASADTGSSTCNDDGHLAEMFDLVENRTKQLDEIEKQLQEKEQKLAAAKQLIDQNLARLEQAEQKLSATVAQVEGASSGDIDQLTRVYETMKPKTAAPLFEQMTPDFAAGFLGQMRPDAAAGIMAGLSSEHAYAISVVLAGRNANAPKN